MTALQLLKSPLDQLVELGTVADIFNGKTPSKGEQRETGHPVLKIRDVDEYGNFRGRFESFVDHELAQKFSDKHLRIGDALILNAAHNSDYVGSKIFFAERGALGALITGEWLTIRARSAALHPSYANHWLRSEGTRRRIRDMVKGIHLYPKDIARLSIPLPSLVEQERIATILDAADALRTKRRAALAKLDTLAQSIFVEMFGDPIQNPFNWPIRELEELIPEDRPLTYGILMPGDDVDEGVPYVRVVDMKDGTIDWRGVRRTTEAISNQYRRSLLRERDLLISIRGHVGRTSIVPAELEGANITQDTARIATAGCEVEFLQEALRHRSVQDWMARRTKGAAVKGINLGDLRTLPIPCPPLEQQDLFAKAIRTIHNQKLLMQEQRQSIEAVFASLQHRAFRGEL